MQYFSVDNKRLVYERNKVKVMEFFTDEIFTKPNVAPFVMIASTNGGKTMIGIDIFHECLKAGYNQMNFITSSMNSKNNDVLRNNILKYCVVEERADICRALNEIHAEQNSITIIQDEDVIAKGEKMMTVTERDQLKILKGKFMTRLREHIPFITNEVCRNNDECAAILAGMNQKETPDEFYNVLQMERQRISDIIKDYQDFDVELNGESMTC